MITEHTPALPLRGVPFGEFEGKNLYDIFDANEEILASSLRCGEYLVTAANAFPALVAARTNETPTPITWDRIEEFIRATCYESIRTERATPAEYVDVCRDCKHEIDCGHSGHGCVVGDLETHLEMVQLQVNDRPKGTDNDRSRV